jgi:hypothetical protein
MFDRDGVIYEFHHLGIPTAEQMPDERYGAQFRMYTSDAPAGLIRVQFHRFEPESPLHLLVRTLPHAASKVSNLDRAIAGSNLLLAPYEPIPGFRVAMVEDGGVPIEFVETSMIDEEIWRPLSGASPAARSSLAIDMDVDWETDSLHPISLLQRFDPVSKPG